MIILFKGLHQEYPYITAATSGTCLQTHGCLSSLSVAISRTWLVSDPLQKYPGKETWRSKIRWYRETKARQRFHFTRMIRIWNGPGSPWNQFQCVLHKWVTMQQWKEQTFTVAPHCLRLCVGCLEIFQWLLLQSCATQAIQHLKARGLWNIVPQTSLCTMFPRPCIHLRPSFPCMFWYKYRVRAIVSKLWVTHPIFGGSCSPRKSRQWKCKWLKDSSPESIQKSSSF